MRIATLLTGKSGGVVRVINMKSSERSLLKGFSGRVSDIAFAHLSTYILGAVDEMGNMFIYEILESQNGKIECELLLNVVRPPDTDPLEEHRLIWCPYMPEDDEASTATGTTLESSAADDAGKLLVLTHGNVVRKWSYYAITIPNVTTL